MDNRVCVIGAGISGIAAARALQKANLPWVCYEAGSKPGGLWRYDNDNAMSNIYKSLHMNTSKDRSAFSDLPMPSHYPDFPHHALVLDYLADYIDHFDLAQSIKTRHQVQMISPVEGGGYAVTVSDPDGKTQLQQFKSVVVCNGHHWDPYRPDLAGSFAGDIIHSSEYKNAADFEEQNVLIVGAGNSACDIACDLAGRAEVTISTRNGAHVVPKYLLGRPLDHWTTNLTSRLPIAVQRALFSALVVLARGPQRSSGFPKPTTRFLTAHPTISSKILDDVGHGRIKPRPDIEFLDGRHVRFKDGAVEPFDTIILATGYSVSFPFFEADFVSAADNELPLYRHVVHPTHEGLFFIGMIQPLGALAPLAEEQAAWVAAIQSGGCKLPARDQMWSEIKRDKAEIDRLFVKSRRHTMEVEFFKYRRQLRTARGS